MKYGGHEKGLVSDGGRTNVLKVSVPRRGLYNVSYPRSLSSRAYQLSHDIYLHRLRKHTFFESKNPLVLFIYRHRWLIIFLATGGILSLPLTLSKWSRLDPPRV